MISMTLLLLLPLAALSAGAPEPPAAAVERPSLRPDKAYAVINACDGRAILAAPGAPPELTPLADSDDQRLILRKRGAGWALESVRGGLFLTPAATGTRLEREPSEVAITERPDGRYYIQAASGAELSSLLDAPCAGGWRIEQFPVIAPTRRVVWVDAAADADQANGSATRPYRTVQAAVDASEPGDMIRVRPGVYRELVTITKERSGQPDAWLVLVSDIPHAALIAPPASEHPAVHVRDASYVEVNGFSMTNAGEGSCLYASYGTHHRFVGNYAHDCGGGGVSSSYNDYAHFEGNVASATSKRSIWQTSGLSFYQPRAEPLAPGQKPEVRLVIRRNAAFLNDNLTLKPNEKIVTDGNGIILDDYRHTQYNSKSNPYPHKTLVEQNLVFGNGGAGIRTLLVDNAVIQDNTSYHNDRVVKPRGPGRSEIGAVLSSGVVWLRNVVVGRPAPGPNRVVMQYGTGKVDYADNIFYEPRRGLPIEQASAGAQTVDRGRNVIGREPVFERASLDESALFSLVAVKGADQVPAAGARMELLPSLERPKAFKALE